MLGATETLGIYLVDIFGAGRTRREPAASGVHLQAADGCAVAGSLGDNALDFLAGQFRGEYLLWRKLRTWP